jgi:hypothetical protein
VTQVDITDRSISIAGGLHRIEGRGLVVLDRKTQKSRRRIPVPQTVVNILQSIKGRQIEMAELTLLHPWNSDGLVFGRSDGSPMSPDAVSHDCTKRTRVLALKAFTCIRCGTASHRFYWLRVSTPKSCKTYWATSALRSPWTPTHTCSLSSRTLPLISLRRGSRAPTITSN